MIVLIHSKGHFYRIIPGLLASIWTLLRMLRAIGYSGGVTGLLTGAYAVPECIAYLIRELSAWSTDAWIIPHTRPILRQNVHRKDPLKSKRELNLFITIDYPLLVPGTASASIMGFEVHLIFFEASNRVFGTIANKWIYWC